MGIKTAKSTIILNTQLIGYEINIIKKVGFNRYAVYYMRDLVEVITGEIKGRFDDGRCAVSRIKYGKGEAMTFNTMLWYGYAKTADDSILSLMSDMLAEYGLIELEYKGNVTIRVAENAEKYLFFIFNYTDKAQKVEVTFRDITFDAVVTSNDSVIIEKDK